jgi:alanine racemase
MNYPLLHISQIVEGHFLGPDPGCLIEHIHTDSRNISFPTSSLFFALKGDRFNGHDYIDSCIKLGVRCFIIENDQKSKVDNNYNFILVDDSVVALQRLARHHRNSFNYPVIGITGSNGKTTAKEWLYQLLFQKFNVVKSPRSYNSQIGVALSVLLMESYFDVALFEAGISRINEMAKLAKMIQCDIGIFTNLGNAHDAGFKSQEEKLQQKLNLFADANTIIYCIDQTDVHHAIKKRYPKKQLLNWSSENNLGAFFQVELLPASSKLSISYGSKRFALDIPFTEKIHIQNFIPCVICALELGLPLAILQKHSLELKSLPMRLEMKAGLHDTLLINDSYNADIPSLRIALQFTEQHNPSKPIRLILSDLLETGKSPYQLYSDVANIIKDHKITKIVCIGKEIEILPKLLRLEANRVSYFPTTQEFIESDEWRNYAEETILIKGARAYRLEQIFELLSKKTHSTYLEIDLSSIAHNLRIYSRFLKPGVKIMVMLKASAYGSGATRLARFLEAQQVDYFAVAYVDEGIELRRAGIQLPILVLNPEPADYPILVKYRLEAEISSITQLRDLKAYFNKKNERLSIHLKIESGMHRLGLERENIIEICEILHEVPQIELVSMFSHLSSAEDSSSDRFTNLQVDEFDEMFEQITKVIGKRPNKHLLNSSGICRFPHLQMDMVRLGIGLYGIDPSGEVQESLEKVHSLKSHIAQIKQLVPGDNVGYNNSFRASKNTRIATLRVGYADGLARLAGNGNYKVWVNGQLAPLIGNICMDLCMVDISKIPNLKVGDEVEIFGKNIAVEELALSAKTIPYEILTNISHRVKRVFIQN